MRALQYAHIDFGISSWWGQGSKTDRRFALMLQKAAGTGFNWTIYYEAAGNHISREAGSPDPTEAQIASDLSYIKSHYASDPSFLHVDGKPVIFVYDSPAPTCATLDRWHQANAAEGFYLQMKVFPGWQSCANQPDSWHQYHPSNPRDTLAREITKYSYDISPGSFKANEGSPRLVRSSATFTAAVKAMTASKAPWQLVTTFNEWGEGTAVESAQEWSSSSGYGSYLDILHNQPG